MQSLEYSEYLAQVFRRDPDPVVPNGKSPLTAVGSHADMYMGLHVAPVFQSIADKVLKQANQNAPGESRLAATGRTK